MTWLVIAGIVAVLIRRQSYDEAVLPRLRSGAYLRPSEGKELRLACVVPLELSVSPWGASEFGLQRKTGVADDSRGLGWCARMLRALKRRLAAALLRPSD